MKKQIQKMNSFLGFLIFIFFFSIANSQERPLFVLFERDPWLMVVGSDSPTFTLYEDGTVIYLQSYEKEKKRKKGEGYRYYITKLTSEAFTKMKSLIVDSESIIQLRKKYSIIAATDQPIEEFYWFIGNKIYYRSVYGQVEYGFDPKMKELTYLFNIVNTIKDFRPEIKNEWKPNKIEVMF